VLCLSLAGKVLAQDKCDDSKSSQNKPVISYNNSDDLSDSSDFSDCKDCGCHCHHHFDFASLAKSFAIESAKVDNFSFDLASSLPLQNTSPQKPPKIVS
jgi:hypothetical protein